MKDKQTLGESLFDDSTNGLAGEPASSLASQESLSVGEFIAQVNQTVKKRFGRGVWLHGEIQEMKVPGHVYFTLVDNDGDKKAVLSASIWQGVYSAMQTLLADSGLQLADGLKVQVFGEPDLYPGNGRFSIKISKIDPRFTLGDLIAQREEIVRQLKLKGLYDANRKVEMPLVPLRVGIVQALEARHTPMCSRPLRTPKSASRSLFTMPVCKVKMRLIQSLPHSRVSMLEKIWMY